MIMYILFMGAFILIIAALGFMRLIQYKSYTEKGVQRELVVTELVKHYGKGPSMYDVRGVFTDDLSETTYISHDRFIANSENHPEVGDTLTVIYTQGDRFVIDPKYLYQQALAFWMIAGFSLVVAIICAPK